MANLLERASVVLTPTAYNNGEALCIKPDDASGDFDFSRNSAATRVNAQGLVENVQILSSNLVQNGNFSEEGVQEVSNGSFSQEGSELVTNGSFDTDSDWTKGTGWSISGGSANCDGTQVGVSDLTQTLSTPSGKSYKITYTISEYTSGSIFVRLNSGNITASQSSVGTFTEYLSGGNGAQINLRADADFIGSIDNVSVKEYITATNTPRLDYSTGAEAFLLEPQSTNLVTYSEDFSSGNWFEYNETSATIDASQSNPSGANGSYKIESLSGLGRFGLSAITVAPSTNYTLSFYVKNINATLLKVILGSGASPGSYTYTSEVNTSNWSRVSVNFTTGAVTSMQIQFIRDLPIGESAYIWGAQLEQQSYSTSYIPTSGTTVTRNQETCINATPEINSEEGVLYAEIAALTKINPSGNITLTDGTGNNRIYIYYLIDNSISVIYNVNSTGASINNFSLANITDQTKIAVRWGNSNVSVWINGTSVLSNTTSNFLPNTLNVLSFDKPSGGGPFEGRTKDLQVYTKALSDAELIKLTT